MGKFLKVGSIVADRWFLNLGMGVVTKVTSARTVVKFHGKVQVYSKRQLMYLQKSTIGAY